MVFMCCECERHYEQGITGDADERMCHRCLYKDEDAEEEYEEL